MSAKNSNKINVPEARAAMDKFKMEAASEVGVNLKEGYNGDLTSREAGSVGGQMVVNLKEGYNGDLTSREAGSVGGQMVKHICPVRTTVVERKNRRVDGHNIAITYHYQLEL